MGKKRSGKIQADTQPQLTRLHGLVQRVQRGDYPSQKILAVEWEKSPRTIQRDLDFIRDVWGLPLEYDRYRYGFYFTESVGKFPMVPISEKELVSVFIAQKALTQYHGTPFEQPLKSAFEKLVSSLKGEISVSWADLDSAISFRGIETSTEDMEVLQSLSGAIRSRNEIEFGYTKLADTQTIRSVRPYHLANIGNQWYLFGYDLMRQDMRKFVPARMSHLQVTARKFQRPKDFSVDKLLKGSFGVFSGGKTLEMKIRFDRARAQLMRERKWHHSQKVRELGNEEVEVTFQLSSFVEIVPWILGWAEHARAVSPKELVAEMKRVVGRLGEVYGSKKQ
jgi:proteasome accessory factor B